MQKSSYTLPPPVHVCDRASRLLKLLPIAALLAAGASQAWAASGCSGKEVDSPYNPYDIYCIGANGGSNNKGAQAVTVTSGDYEIVYGGYSCTTGGGCIEGTDTSGKANNNELVLDIGDDIRMPWGIYGGVAEGGEATGNTVTVKSSIRSSNVGAVIGGIAKTATGNTVVLANASISGSGHGFDTVLGGQYYGSDTPTDLITGNTLTVDKLKQFSVFNSFGNFKTINFILPANISAGDRVLWARDAYFLDGFTSITIKVTGTPALKVDDKITLLEVRNLKKGTFPTANVVSDPDTGYKFALKPETDADGDQLLIATVAAVPASGGNVVITPQASPDACNANITCTAETVAYEGNVTCTAKSSDVCIYKPDTIKLVDESGVNVGDPNGCRGSGDTCTLKGVRTNVTVSAEFTKKHRIIGIAEPARGGTVSCKHDPVFDGAGATFTCIVTPTEGFQFDGKLDAWGPCDGTTCTVPYIDEDVHVVGRFYKPANLTGITVSNLRNGGTGCRDVMADISFEGSGEFCSTLTLEQEGLGKGSSEFTKGTAPIPPMMTSLPNYWDGEFGLITDVNPDKPFTLTISAGDAPDCKGIIKTVKIDGCGAAPKLTNIYTVSVKADKPDAPTITCDKTSVEDGDTVTCSYTPDANWTPNLSGLTLPTGCNLVGETAVTCTVTADINLTIPFNKVDTGGDTPGGDTPGGDTPGGDTPGGDTPGGTGTGGGYRSGGDSSSPTMGELGLLLSGLALAGAAAPALRRREKQGKKTDTRQ